MQKCDAPHRSPKKSLATQKLEDLCNSIPAAVKQVGQDLELKYYIRLAENAMGPKWPSGKPPLETRQLLDDVQDELDHLYHSLKILAQSYHAMVGLADELGARVWDVRKSRDRKWYIPNPPANAGIDLEEQRLNHFAQGINLYKNLLICGFGSFAGVVLEMIWAYARYGLIESRRGLVYGPFNLLYGTGAVFLTQALYKYRNRGILWSFCGGFIVGSALEYTCSWLQETLLGSRSWDYSQMPLNLNGRICFSYSVFWGILGVLWIKDLYPRMAKWILKIPNKAGKALTWALTVFLAFNIIVSCIAVGRWSKRLEGEAASNSFWELVDKRFPDRRMEKIFPNMNFEGK